MTQGWVPYVNATKLVISFKCSDWGVNAFLNKHENKWFNYITNGPDYSNPAMYMIRAWQNDALMYAKKHAWDAPGAYYEELARIGYDYLMTDNYPLCTEYLEIWDFVKNRDFSALNSSRIVKV